VELQVLGPLQVVAGGETLALGRAQQHAVLPLLSIRAPEPVAMHAARDRAAPRN
jgi:DNA-binding SARP family transcriptional activator